MTFLIRSFFALLLSLVWMGNAAAQVSAAKSDLTINDIAGDWRIEVNDRPNDDFKGTAMIPRSQGKDDKSIMAETITEDKCCSGGNHARVLQDSLITIDETGLITVDSKIVKYLLRKEELDLTYSPDDFELRWQDADTLIGTANGYTPIRWVREKLFIS